MHDSTSENLAHGPDSNCTMLYNHFKYNCLHWANNKFSSPATTCGEDTITLKGIGTGTFKFLETNVGITASVKCADGAEEMITRYCSYNPATREGDWTPADSSKCKSAFTEAVVNSTKVLDDVDVTVIDHFMMSWCSNFSVHVFSCC